MKESTLTWSARANKQTPWFKVSLYFVITQARLQGSNDLSCKKVIPENMQVAPSDPAL